MLLSAELRSENGVFITQLDLEPSVFHHKERDISVLHFEDEKTVLDTLKKIGGEILELNSTELKENEVIYIFKYKFNCQFILLYI